MTRCSIKVCGKFLEMCHNKYVTKLIYLLKQEFNTGNINIKNCAGNVTVGELKEWLNKVSYAELQIWCYLGILNLQSNKDLHL